MAKWIVLGVLALGGNAMAGTTRGYIAENRGMEFYAGLDYENSDVQLPLSYFNQVHKKTIWACMDKRTTHAIEVTTRETKQRVPTGIPGQQTFFHDTVVTGVKCVKATGFLQHWRAQFRRD
jgi:hypothetical protein